MSLEVQQLESNPPSVRRRAGKLRRERVARLAAKILGGRTWLALRLASDLAMLIAGCIVGLAMTSPVAGSWVLIGFPPLALALLHARGRYVVGKRDLVLDSVAPGVGAVSISAMTVATAHLLLGPYDTISALMVWTWFAALVGVTIVGLALPMIQRASRRRGLVASPTLLVGTDTTVLDIGLQLARQPEYGLHVVGFLSNAPAAIPDQRTPVLGGLDDLEEVTATYGVRTVIIGYPDASLKEMLRFVGRCDRLGLQTNVMPRFSAVMNYQTRFEYLGTVPLLNLRAVNPESWSFAVKHAIDRLVAGLLLLALSPLLAILAIAVRLSSPGPIFFRQPRAGRDGRVFNLLKFRTMRLAGEDDPRHELRPGLAPGGVEGIDRRTRVGRLLRGVSVDELPQLVNVIRGDMSLVGPRPERPEFAELFRRDIERYQDRHRVRSGITGWAQVHGHRGQTSLVDRVEFDNFYIEHWSLSLDVKIMLLTIPALLRGS